MRYSAPQEGYAERMAANRPQPLDLEARPLSVELNPELFGGGQRFPDQQSYENHQEMNQLLERGYDLRFDDSAYRKEVVQALLDQIPQLPPEMIFKIVSHLPRVEQPQTPRYAPYIATIHGPRRRQLPGYISGRR